MCDASSFHTMFAPNRTNRKPAFASIRLKLRHTFPQSLSQSDRCRCTTPSGTRMRIKSAAHDDSFGGVDAPAAPSTQSRHAPTALASHLLAGRAHVGHFRRALAR